MGRYRRAYDDSGSMDEAWQPSVSSGIGMNTRVRYSNEEVNFINPLYDANSHHEPAAIDANTTDGIPNVRYGTKTASGVTLDLPEDTIHLS